jgi:malonyl-CoA/methylmalonyl-CoA synthetase
MFPELTPGNDHEALRFDTTALTYGELAQTAGALANHLQGRTRVAVWATPTIETCVAVVAALTAGVPVIPLNPKTGERELAHIIADSTPELLLAAPESPLPSGVANLPKRPILLRTEGSPNPRAAEPAPESPGFIVYTSGTTGPPKGVILPRRAITSNLDALAEAWEWTVRDVLVHGLPLFHVHGLIIGIVGPLRRGGTVWHLGRFDPQKAAEAITAGATMMFGVPTMYHRLAQECEKDPTVAKAISKARLLVSGSAALPATDHQSLTKTTGQKVAERYGMTETLMNCAVRADGDRRPGAVGPPLPGVSLRLVDESGKMIELQDGETVGEIEVKGENLFQGYLNRPDATGASMHNDWFRTGDMAIQDPDGYVRIVGRKATDLIKSGGYKIGAGEIENALLEHPAVAEAAVTAEPDEDLGERIVAWIVPTIAGEEPPPDELANHVARLLTPHKRPRVVRYVSSLPRNEMGKVMKRELKP